MTKSSRAHSLPGVTTNSNVQTNETSRPEKLTGADGATNRVGWRGRSPPVRARLRGGCVLSGERGPQGCAAWLPWLRRRNGRGCSTTAVALTRPASATLHAPRQWPEGFDRAFLAPFSPPPVCAVRHTQAGAIALPPGIARMNGIEQLGDIGRG